MEVTCPPMPGAESQGAYVIRVSNERNVDFISITGVLVYHYAPDCFQCSEQANPDEGEDVVIPKVKHTSFRNFSMTLWHQYFLLSHLYPFNHHICLICRRTPVSSRTDATLNLTSIQRTLPRCACRILGYQTPSPHGHMSVVRTLFLSSVYT